VGVAASEEGVGSAAAEVEGAASEVVDWAGVEADVVGSTTAWDEAAEGSPKMRSRLRREEREVGREGYNMAGKGRISTCVEQRRRANMRKRGRGRAREGCERAREGKSGSIAWSEGAQE
jgi:hypothetical protein